MPITLEQEFRVAYLCLPKVVRKDIEHVTGVELHTTSDGNDFWLCSSSRVSPTVALMLVARYCWIELESPRLDIIETRKPHGDGNRYEVTSYTPHGGTNIETKDAVTFSDDIFVAMVKLCAARGKPRRKAKTTKKSK